MSIRHALYTYGNAAIRRLRQVPLILTLRRVRAQYLTRKLQLSKNVAFLFTLSLQDKGLSKQLLTNDWREYTSTLYFIDHFLKKDDVVLDVGANLGYFALIEASYAPSTYVYALEPVQESYRTLTATVALNGFTNIRAFNLGISDKCEIREILVSNYLNWSTMNINAAKAISAGPNTVRRETVELVTLTEFCKRFVDRTPTLIRMDVEGFEYEILTGNTDFLQAHNAKLFIEFHSNLLGRDRSIELLTLLRDLNYEIEMYVQNLEYCKTDLFFRSPAGRGVQKCVTISELLGHYEAKSPTEVSAQDGCMLFLYRSCGSSGEAK